MKKMFLILSLVLLSSPVMAKEFIVKAGSEKGNYFSPENLTIQVGDTVTFENTHNKKHDVMFINVPKDVNEMIMSPMMTKKGDKFSYTFSVEGTYQFHCHPHEEEGMAGTLIVGTPSKEGETKAMDHHKLKPIAQKQAVTSATQESGIQATGKIVSVDTDSRKVKITHDPIQALDWPKMTMVFTADPSVDLSSYKEGDSISFTLISVGADDYTISKISR